MLEPLLVSVHAFIAVASTCHATEARTKLVMMCQHAGPPDGLITIGSLLALKKDGWGLAPGDYERIFFGVMQCA